MTEPTYTALYRLHDAKDALLYVGVSDQIKVRLAAHRATKEWWPEVARVKVRLFVDRPSALLAEDCIIRTGNPRYNLFRSVGKTPLRSVRIPDELWHAAQDAAKENGEDLSAVIRAALDQYVRRTRRKKTD